MIDVDPGALVDLFLTSETEEFREPQLLEEPGFPSGREHSITQSSISPG